MQKKMPKDTSIFKEVWMHKFQEHIQRSMDAQVSRKRHMI